MADVLLLLWNLAALAVAVAGLLWIVGAKRLRDRFLRMAGAIAAIAALLPLVVGELGALAPDVGGAIRLPDVAVPVSVVLLGHAALALAILSRRRGPEARRRAEQVLERARSRERPRIATAHRGDPP